MTLASPNPSRSFDEARKAVRFMGHDGPETNKVADRDGIHVKVMPSGAISFLLD